MAGFGSFSGARGFRSRGQLEPGKGGGVSSTAQGRPAAMATAGGASGAGSSSSGSSARRGRGELEFGIVKG